MRSSQLLPESHMPCSSMPDLEETGDSLIAPPVGVDSRKQNKTKKSTFKRDHSLRKCVSSQKE